MIEKPLICTFYELCAVLAILHLWEPRHIADLHDVWSKGAPTPDSIIRNPKGFDERKQQVGNHVARIVLPTLLTQWINNIASARGMSTEKAYQLLMATLR